jgi:thiol-disulfide isomerase/thioredoxin
MKKLIFLASFIFFLFLPPVAFAKQKVELWLFWGQGCPHCAAEKPFLEELAPNTPAGNSSYWDAFWQYLGK